MAAANGTDDDERHSQPMRVCATISGADLRQVRERIGLRQAELARRLGYSRSQVSGWEGGRYTVPREVVPQIFEILADAKAERVEYERVLAELGRWDTIAKL